MRSYYPSKVCKKVLYDCQYYWYELFGVYYKEKENRKGMTRGCYVSIQDRLLNKSAFTKTRTLPDVYILLLSKVNNTPLNSIKQKVIKLCKMYRKPDKEYDRKKKSVS